MVSVIVRKNVHMDCVYCECVPVGLFECTDIELLSVVMKREKSLAVNFSLV